MASGYLRLMLDSARRCAAATQDAAEDARKAAQEAPTGHHAPGWEQGL